MLREELIELVARKDRDQADRLRSLLEENLNFVTESNQDVIAKCRGRFAMTSDLDQKMDEYIKERMWNLIHVTSQENRHFLNCFSLADAWFREELSGVQSVSDQAKSICSRREEQAVALRDRLAHIQASFEEFSQEIQCALQTGAGGSPATPALRSR